MKINFPKILNSAREGLELAQDVLSRLQTDSAVVLDFAATERMTPSYANAFIMTLMAEMSSEQLKERLVLQNLSPAIIARINRSIERYKNGVRLSNQPQVA